MGNILFGIGFMVAGLSGKMVLIGTESGGALAGVGVLMLLYGLKQVRG